MAILRPPVLRFAPSPTGSLHLGGLRTALYNYLFAKKHGGKWILRIEDTDSARLVPGAVDNIRKSLEWAGLGYDYGPGVGGPHASYFQSERLELYHYYANKLVEGGHAYHCFCSPSELGSIKERLAKRGSNATYDKSCLHLSEEEVARKKRAGEKFVIRLNDGSPPKRKTPDDIIFGSLKDAHNSLPTDPILYKSDGFPTYHLASIVDDHDMGITHVIRGEEWLPSLPLHLDLYSCLGFEPPQFGHLPLLLNPDGSKMSKRKGDVSVSDYSDKGWMAPAVLNWLALAGWGTSRSNKDNSSDNAAAPSSTEVFTLSELIDKFDLSVLTPRRSILDPKKLQVLNARHLHRAIESETSLQALVAEARTLLEAEYTEEKQKKILSRLDLNHLLKSIKDRIKNIKELPSLIQFLFVEPSPALPDEPEPSMRDLHRYSQVMLKYADAIVETRVEQRPWDETVIQSIENLRTEKDELVYLRRALTGQKTGLPLLITMQLLGRDETFKRLSDAQLWAKTEMVLRK